MKYKTVMKVSLAITLALLLLSVALFGLAQTPESTLAAPMPPHSIEYPAVMTITSTKQASPGPLVGVDQAVTYTIIFLVDNNPGMVQITDEIPLSTTYHAGSITATRSAGTGISTTVISNLLVWTATNVTTNTRITATFAVTVNKEAGPGVSIANTAWLTDGTTIYSATTTITTTNPVITLTKTTDKTSAAIGEVISYSYRITNTGNVTLSNITLVDDLLGEITPTKTTLGPDEETTAAKAYTVQASDYPGPLVNTAIVTGTETVGNSRATNQATALVTVEKIKIYLPIILKPEQVDLTVNASNTNGITSLKIGTYVCTTPINDGFSTPCPKFPPGNYYIVAVTNRCGTLTANLSFVSGPDTLNIFCN